MAKEKEEVVISENTFPKKPREKELTFSRMNGQSSNTLLVVSQCGQRFSSSKIPKPENKGQKEDQDKFEKNETFSLLRALFNLIHPIFNSPDGTIHTSRNHLRITSLTFNTSHSTSMTT